MHSLITRLALMLILATSFCSCQSALHLHDVNVATEPFVQLYNGEKHTGKNVEQKMSTFKNHITVDEKTFKASEVQFYSDGTKLFANVGFPTFATLVCTGKIRLFKWEGTITSFEPGFGGAPGKVSRHNSKNLFLQAREGSPLLGFRYNNLKPLVMPNTPEYDALKRYERHRKISRILGYTGLALVVGGVALIDVSEALSIAMVATGVAGMIPSGVLSSGNERRLLRVIILADDLEDSRAKRKKEKGSGK